MHLQNCPKPAVTNISNMEFIETNTHFSSVIFALHLHLISIDISIEDVSIQI